jgi:propanol-preferring alcohol dehydrogenase
VIGHPMLAMVLNTAGDRLAEMEMPLPDFGPDEILIRIRTCGVCRTDLHIVDRELSHPKLPLIPGHEIIGNVVHTGERVGGFQPGDRIGVPWLGYSCAQCRYCRSGRENLCEKALFTGYSRDGGYAEFAVAHHRYCFHIPEIFSDAEAAPLLCAGLIGYRSYRMTGANVERLGIYGFGAAAHIVAQVAAFMGQRFFAFTTPGDVQAQNFARRLGACWAGDSTAMPPEELDAAIIFAPVGSLVPAALRATAKGGTVVCGGIHMSDIPSFPYQLLWGERSVRSVANLTRQDGLDLLELAAAIPIRTETLLFRLDQANEALDRLRCGALEGAAVLAVPS